MNQEMQASLKKEVAKNALEYLEEDICLGIGTGSTVDYFIELLTTIKINIKSIVSSSNRTTENLIKKGFKNKLTSNNNAFIDIYIDGTDEINENLVMIKGGGGALTGEKILANNAKKFICIADSTKYVSSLGNFPVAIEVIPLARSYVARELVKLGASVSYRENFVTDYGNCILDVYGLNLLDPLDMEIHLNSISGVVINGIFAKRKADILLLSTLDVKNNDIICKKILAKNNQIFSHR